MATASKCSPVESILQLPACLGLPCLDGHPVLLLDPVPVPLWYHVEAAERYDPQIGGQVVDVAALESLFVLVVLVLEVHHPQEHALEMELAHRRVVVLDEGVRQELRE